MKLKQSFYSQQDAARKAAKASDAATRAFVNKQAVKAHMGRKQASFAAPLKNVSRQASGGYLGRSPFGKGK
jgi:hypothetical protein